MELTNLEEKGALVLAFLVCAGAVMLPSARARMRRATTAEDAPSAATPKGPLHVPHAAPGGLTLDGKLVDPGWKNGAHTGRFTTKDGALAIPSSEARITWDERAIYFGLHAADDDIRSSDHFDVAIRGPAGGTSITLFPRGPGAAAAGTLDDSSDEDEEWGVEVAIPLADLGGQKGAPLSVRLERCDTPKGAPPSCGGWSGEIILD